MLHASRGASGGVLRNFFSPEHAKNGPPNLLREIGTMVGVPASVSAGQASESSLTVTLTRGPRTQTSQYPTWRNQTFKSQLLGCALCAHDLEYVFCRRYLRREEMQTSRSSSQLAVNLQRSSVRAGSFWVMALNRIKAAMAMARKLVVKGLRPCEIKLFA